MPVIESLVVVGASGTGKTTLVEGLRGEDFASSIIIPMRRSTRPSRSTDNPTELEIIDDEAFNEGVATGMIYPYWQRHFDFGRANVVKYGFVSVPAHEERLRVYSANNAFLTSNTTSTETVLASARVALLAARPEVRKQRIEEQLHDLRPSARRFRLLREGVEPDGTETLIDTNDPSPEAAQAALNGLVRQLLEFNDAIRNGGFAGTFEDFKAQV